MLVEGSGSTGRSCGSHVKTVAGSVSAVFQCRNGLKGSGWFRNYWLAEFLQGFGVYGLGHSSASAKARLNQASDQFCEVLTNLSRRRKVQILSLHVHKGTPMF